MSASVVYFIRQVDTDLVKIGITTALAGRLAAIRNGSGRPLEVLRTVPGGRPQEKWLHQHYASSRADREWFKLCPTMLTIEVPGELPQKSVRALTEIQLLIVANMRRYAGAALAEAEGAPGPGLATEKAAKSLAMSPRRFQGIMRSEIARFWAAEYEDARRWYRGWLERESQRRRASLDVIEAEARALDREFAGEEAMRAVLAESRSAISWLFEGTKVDDESDVRGIGA